MVTSLGNAVHLMHGGLLILFTLYQGDSGGPLICAVNGTYTVIGVTSYGANPCGQVGRFGVYAKVSSLQCLTFELFKLFPMPIAY